MSFSLSDLIYGAQSQSQSQSKNQSQTQSEESQTTLTPVKRDEGSSSNAQAKAKAKAKVKVKDAIKYDYQQNEEDRDFFIRHAGTGTSTSTSASTPNNNSSGSGSGSGSGSKRRNQRSTSASQSTSTSTSIPGEGLYGYRILCGKRKRIQTHDPNTGLKHYTFINLETPQELSHRKQLIKAKIARRERSKKLTVWDFRREKDVGYAIRNTIEKVKRMEMEVEVKMKMEMEKKSKAGKGKILSAKRTRKERTSTRIGTTKDEDGGEDGDRNALLKDDADVDDDDGKDGSNSDSGSNYDSPPASGSDSDSDYDDEKDKDSKYTSKSKSNALHSLHHRSQTLANTPLHHTNSKLFDPMADPSHPKHHIYQGYSAPKRKYSKHGHINISKYNYSNTLRKWMLRPECHTVAGTASKVTSTTKSTSTSKIKAEQTEDEILLHILTLHITGKDRVKRDHMIHYAQRREKRLTRLDTGMAYPLLDLLCHNNINNDHTHLERLDLGNGSAKDRSRMPSGVKPSRWKNVLPPYLQPLLHSSTSGGDASKQAKRHFESSIRAKSAAARYIVGCAGLLPYTSMEHMGSVLDGLQYAHGQADRRRMVQNQSQELASNWILYDAIRDKMEEMRNSTCNNNAYAERIRGDWNFIREQLLTQDAECFTHPWSSAHKFDISKIATLRRKKIYEYVMKLYEEYKESQSRSGNDSGNSNRNDSGTDKVKVTAAATRKKRARDDDIEASHHGAKRRKLDDGMESFGKFSSAIDGGGVDDDDNNTDTDAKATIKSKDKQQLPWHCNYGISKAKILPLERMTRANSNKNTNSKTNTDACEKYSQVVHNSPIDLSTIHLILCLAYSMMAIHRLEDRNRDRDQYGNGEEERNKKSSSSSSLNKSPIWKIHDEIEDYFKYVSSTIDAATPFDKLMMSAPLALVSSMRQRYIANSGMYGHTYTSIISANGVSPNDHFHLEENPNDKKLINYSEIANELASYGHTLMDQKLKVFHTIHLTTGIAVLAKSFPNHSAEILSRPCFDNSRHREGNDEEYTPFDLMRMALEETDLRNGLIRGKATIKYEDTSNVVSIDKLIQEFEFAAQMFQGILRYEPNHFDTYCWYVAARIGSVVLASGNNIGEGARAACPHDFSIEENDPIFGNRSRHGSYDALRAHASKAFRQFLCLPQKSNHMGERYHIAVTSLLEWKEAINLLAMRPQLDKNKFHKIRCLHATHTFSLARFECSDISLAKLLDLSRQGYITRDEVFNNLGLMIEKYPHDPKYWNILASGLQSCGASCGRRREPYWWAHEFIRRWDDLFFDFPKRLIVEPTIAQRSLDTIKHVRDSIVVRTDSQNHASEKMKTDLNLFDWGNLKNLVRRNPSDGSWLWPIEPSDMDEEDHLDAIDDATDEIKIFDSYLPQKIASGACDSSLDYFGVATNLFSDMAVTSTALAVKSIIAHEMYSHIFGLFKAKQYIKHTIQYLLQKCVSGFETKGDCDAPAATEEFGILVWLQENTELNVVRHLDRIIERAHRRNKVKSRGASINVGNNLFQFASI